MKKTRFQNVIDNLKETQGITQGEIAKQLNESINIEIDSSKIYQYKTGYISLPDSIIEKMHKTYNVNPDYLRGTSECMYDDAKRKYDFLKYLVKDWKTTEKHYTDSQGKHIIDKYLHLTIENKLYNFLINVDSKKILKEQGLQSFEEEFEKCKKEYNDNGDTTPGEYVLIPRNCFCEIVESEMRNRLVLDELLNLHEHMHYIDSEEPTES